MSKAAIYARYSTDQQDKTSIDGQISNCEALAAREGLKCVATFTDEGISGNDDSRPQYQSMLPGEEAPIHGLPTSPSRASADCSRPDRAADRDCDAGPAIAPARRELRPWRP